MILGFFLGLMQFLFWLVIIFAIIVGIGYIAYRLLNKTPGVSFQDFVIDTIFHR